jgi:trimethylamine--corrinoid protein Co-methyltransferase
MANYEQWEEEGSEDSYKKANRVWKQMLKNYQAPALDDATAEELNAFVVQRRAEIRAGKPRTEWKS